MKFKVAISCILFIVCLFLSIATAETVESEVALTARGEETGNVTLLVQVVKATETVLQKGATETAEPPGATIHLETIDEIRIKTETEKDRKADILFLPSAR